MHEERYADSPTSTPSLELCDVGSCRIGKRLDGSVWCVEAIRIYSEVPAYRMGQSVRQGHDRFYLHRIAYHHGSTRAEDRADSGLRKSLPGFGYEQPAE